MTNIYEFKFSLMDLTLASQILNIQNIETQSNNQSIFTNVFQTKWWDYRDTSYNLNPNDLTV